MVGMFETTFQHASSTPLPPTISIEIGISVLHDFDTVVRLSPDCRGCKPIQAPISSKNGQAKSNNDALNVIQAQMSYYEVEDDLPFIPKRMWSGGVKYTADFLPTPDGCDITVHAPGGFTSTNHWRLLRDAVPEHAEENHNFDPRTKDLLHMRTDQGGGGWYVQILSDARCPKAFASFVKGFLKNSHQQLQAAFIDKLKTMPMEEHPAEAAEQPGALMERPQQKRRPTLGRRRSSIL